MGALNLASLRTDNWISLDDPQGTGLEQVFMDACRVAGFTPQVAQRINDVTSMISPVPPGWEWRWFRSRRGPYALITWCISISGSAGGSELSMVYHRHIRSAVVRKVISLLNTAER